MRARPAGPAQSSVFHNSARRGPTKEAHRRALNRPDGLVLEGRFGIAGCNSATGKVPGPKSASARPGPAPGRVRPMPSPGGNTTRPDRRRRQGRTSSPPTPTAWDGPAADRRLRELRLDPGSRPDGPGDAGRAFRPPRSGTRRARACRAALPAAFPRSARQPLTHNQPVAEHFGGGGVLVLIADRDRVEAGSHLPRRLVVAAP
jgi:hypothetical protein